MVSEAGFLSILGLRVDLTSMAETVTKIVGWLSTRESRVVCVANVHMTMEAFDDPGLLDVLNSADMIVPDGMPLVWVSRMSGFSSVSRVRGPDLMLLLCKEAARLGFPVALFGGRSGDLQEKLRHSLHQAAPGLQLAAAIAPPFTPMTPSENDEFVRVINESGARLLFVGIGCPKQEKWMLAHRDRIHAVMIGVGAAFDLFSGVTRSAPRWLQDAGLEWLFRLATEPRRLWKRYLKHNPRFAFLAALQVWKSRS